MDKFEPTSLDLGDLGGAEQEWSVEDMAQMEAIDTTAPEALKEESADQLALETVASVEPTEAEAVAEIMTSAAPVSDRLLPIRPIQRTVSGRYKSCRQTWQLELRIDVDGRRPLKRISGDFYQTSGSTVSYFGSFVVNSPTLHVSATQVRIEGIGTYTWGAGSPKVRVIIPRHTVFQPPAAAHVQFMTLDNRRGAAYTCLFESSYFRTVQYEQDYVKDMTPFSSYNTGSLPSGGPARTLTVTRAYAEAGIEMQTTGAWNEVPLTGAGSNARWSNAELHAAMETQFSLWKDVPQWKVWLLVSHLHEMGPGLRGIMFDQKDKQRQGCAVFNAGIGGTDAVKLRDQLYTYVHELGHCFNLFHSFHKKFMNPPMPNRLDARSWMNYPRNYRRPDGSGGEAAFWNDFPFQFDNLELIHLRHAFRNNVVMGGNPFGTGAALEDPEAFAAPVEDNSGLKLELEAPKASLAYGEPAVVEIKLRLTDMRGKTVHSHLHPNLGFVRIGIRKPSGQVMAYEPLMEHCVEVDTTPLDEKHPALYESAYIGYGKDGFYFDQIGTYQIRTVYHALDGSEVLSNTLTLRVRAPLSHADEEVADLFFGDEQGTLLYLLGSDSESLKKGNNAFDKILKEYGEHPLAVYARLIKGINEAREFKTFSDTRKFTAREPYYEESAVLLSSVVDASEVGVGVDNITLNMAMSCLTQAQQAQGKEKEAKATTKRMVDIFRKKDLNPHVMERIEAQKQVIDAQGAGSKAAA